MIAEPTQATLRHVAITGASGAVGRALAPRLRTMGFQLLVAGRDPSRLAELFPQDAHCSLDELPGRMAGLDGIIHLAGLNSDRGAGEASFDEANVRLTAHLASAAAMAGVGLFVFASSIHALDPEKRGAYARSKREAADMLASVPELKVAILYLATLHGSGCDGRLAFLNRLPSILSRPLLAAASAWRPVFSVDQLAETLAGLFSGRASAPQIDGSQGNLEHLILTEGQDRNLVYRLFFAFADLVFALAVIVGLGWLLALLAVAAGLQAGASGLMLQPRAGRGGRPFRMLKLRTMVPQAVEVPTHESPADQITPLGRVLRATKVDELPQAVNVLARQMSLIGPRPCLLSQDDLIEERRKQGVLDMRPGITGHAQALGVDMRDPAALARCEREYARLRCIALDLRIMVSTISSLRRLWQ